MMDFSLPHITEYLRHRLHPSVKATDVRQLGRGSSRETWVVSLSGQGQPSRLVFRLDFPTGSIIPTSLEQEYHLYDQLGGTDVPVAGTLWWEDDPAWTDRPFYVRNHVEGSWHVPGFLDPDPRF
ncbi:MAG: hypothetical protein AB7D33_14895, partial [Sphingobium sp.]